MISMARLCAGTPDCMSASSSMGRNAGSLRSAAATLMLSRKSGWLRKCRPEIPQGMTHHQPGESSHEAGFFGDPDEDLRAHGKAFFVGPARQRLCPYDAFGSEIDDRLVDHPQLVFPDRPAELLLHVAAAPVDKGEQKAEKRADHPAHHHANFHRGAIGLAWPRVWSM